MKARKPRIGLCGGIGSGKSQVAAEFERQGCFVVSSDRLNHEVLREPAVAATLRAWWGDEVLLPDGTPDRGRIAAIVFEDRMQKERLERLVYPLIDARREAMIAAVEDNSAIKAIVIDSPLLLESNLGRTCDTLVFVDTSEIHRRNRLREQRGWSDEDVSRREAWQMPLAEKRMRAEFVVNNDGPADNLCPQVAEILRTIVTRHR